MAARAASSGNTTTPERQGGADADLESEGDISDLITDDLLDFAAEGSQLNKPAWPTISDVHRALRPLQADADRVGKQVEQFAETLDRLTNDTRGKPQEDCTNALKLVDGYRQIARSTVRSLRDIHAPENKSRTSYRDSVHSTTADDLEKWQQEEQTWDLLGVMLQVQYPSSATPQESSSRGSLVRPSKDTEIDRFSAESDVWSRFLAEDDQAWERHSIVEWLKTCAMGSGQAIEQVVQELETDADRGSGLCAHSWLYTKEAIKGQKRLRSWPQALAPDSPGIDTSLRNADKSKSLVTQLDPDAATRQARGLEHQDENYERATWLACWEMIRRGEDWDSIRVWCQDRVESWRAIAVRGDPRYHPFNKHYNNALSPGAAAGWQSRALWRKVCALAAQSEGADKFEAAVYGAVSGHLPSMKAVCCTWNDYLFAHYNCYVLGAFDDYIANSFSNQLPDGIYDKAGLLNISMTSGNRAKSGNQLVTHIGQLKPMSEEAKGPFKLLQGSLIGKTFDGFSRNNGALLYQTMDRLGRSRNYSRFLRSLEKSQAQGKIPTLIKPDDYQIIRIVTHICLIYQGLATTRSKRMPGLGTENFLDAYISFLSKAGKQQLLPLYASFLSSERAIGCMAREIRLVVEYGERQTMMRLMKQYDIDLSKVLNLQMQMSMKKTVAEEEKKSSYPTLCILDSKKQGEMRTIKNGFMGVAITDDQHDLINGFEWYLLLDDYWEQTLATGALLYSYLFKLVGSKGLAAAKEMSKRVPFSSLYHRHARGRSTTNGQLEQVKPPTQSDAFQNLEQLVHALTALEAWQAEVKKKPRDVEMSNAAGKRWRDSLRKASESVEAHVQPLLGGWLQFPQDESEAVAFEKIREACLPEVLLAYTAVLNYSSQFLSRSYLFKSMELGAAIAAPESDLAGCFMSSKRMPELVDALAVTSMNMLLAEEYGIGSKKMSAKMGLWSSKGSSIMEEG
ncbi:MAG: hypothetical protein Q9168_002422 [Polycauliona sp. 1 TL-2023]